MSATVMQAVFPINERRGENLGLYDNHHPNGKIVKAALVMDITALRQDEDKDKCRALLMYANTVRGRIVQVHDCHPGKDFGMHTHLYFDENTDERDEIVERVAHWLGLKPLHMLSIIHQYAPKK
jgi:hypothetical protein